MSTHNPSTKLSITAEMILREMTRNPGVLQYHTKLLGPAYTDKDLERLDEAYLELDRSGLIESSDSIVMYFGQPKRLYKLSEAGRKRMEGAA